MVRQNMMVDVTLVETDGDKDYLIMVAENKENAEHLWQQILQREAIFRVTKEQNIFVFEFVYPITGFRHLVKKDLTSDNMFLQKMEQKGNFLIGSGYITSDGNLSINSPDAQSKVELFY
jgi:hypothetical protein